jgi:hypothetical protein
MGFPLVAALGLIGAGTAANIYGNKKRLNNQQDMQQQYANNMQALRDLNMQQFGDLLSQSGMGARMKMMGGAKGRHAAAMSRGEAPTTGVGDRQGVSDVSKTESAAALSGALADVQEQVDAQAELSAIGSSMAEQGRNMKETEMAMSLNNNAGKGWDQVLRNQMAASDSVGSGYRMVGDLLTGAGQVGLMSGGGTALGGWWDSLFGKTPGLLGPNVPAAAGGINPATMARLNKLTPVGNSGFGG